MGFGPWRFDSSRPHSPNGIRRRFARHDDSVRVSAPSCRRGAAPAQVERRGDAPPVRRADGVCVALAGCGGSHGPRRGLVAVSLAVPVANRGGAVRRSAVAARARRVDGRGLGARRRRAVRGLDAGARPAREPAGRRVDRPARARGRPGLPAAGERARLRADRPAGDGVRHARRPAGALRRRVGPARPRSRGSASAASGGAPSSRRGLPDPDGIDRAKGIAVGPDHTIYVSVGSGSAATRPRGVVLAFRPGGARLVFATGVRNGAGLAFAPDGTLWSAVNGENGPDALARLTAGRNLGWPYCDAERRRPGYGSMPLVADAAHEPGRARPRLRGARARRARAAAAHTAPLGFHFLAGSALPRAWTGGAVVAAHGSFANAARPPEPCSGSRGRGARSARRSPSPPGSSSPTGRGGGDPPTPCPGRTARSTSPTTTPAPCTGSSRRGSSRQHLDVLGRRPALLRGRARDRAAEVDQRDELLVVGEADRGAALGRLEQLRRAPVRGEAAPCAASRTRRRRTRSRARPRGSGARRRSAARSRRRASARAGASTPRSARPPRPAARASRARARGSATAR